MHTLFNINAHITITNCSYQKHTCATGSRY